MYAWKIDLCAVGTWSETFIAIPFHIYIFLAPNELIDHVSPDSARWYFLSCATIWINIEHFRLSLLSRWLEYYAFIFVTSKTAVFFFRIVNQIQLVFCLVIIYFAFMQTSARCFVFVVLWCSWKLWIVLWRQKKSHAHSTINLWWFYENENIECNKLYVDDAWRRNNSICVHRPRHLSSIPCSTC